jgi:hypothetical protein
VLAYYSVAADREFWSEHWGGHTPEQLLAIARTSPLTDLIVAALPKTGVVLEAGCGLGQYVVLLRERWRRSASTATGSRRWLRIPTTPRGSCASCVPAHAAPVREPPPGEGAATRLVVAGSRLSSSGRFTRSRRCACSDICCSWSLAGRDTLSR